ncbi:MAG TPA: hypothetical protein VGK93_02425 [Candidatus Eisenbacteria bacterium]|jgi:hypothetical protein
MSAAHRYSQSRRRFVRLLGWAGAVAVAPGGPALAAAARARRESAATRASASKPPAPTAKSPEVSEDARALAAVLKRRYGEHWNPDQLKSITSDVDGDLKAAHSMREVKLENGEEPDFTFKA